MLYHAPAFHASFYSLLADTVAVIHFGYVAFVVLGLLAILLGGLMKWKFVRNFWFRVIHLAMISIVIFQSLIGMMCPLTVLEYDLRIAAGQQNVSDMAFVARLIHQLMFFEFPPIVFTIGYCLFGLAVLFSWLLFPPSFPWKPKNGVSSGQPPLTPPQ